MDKIMTEKEIKDEIRSLTCCGVAIDAKMELLGVAHNWISQGAKPEDVCSAFRKAVNDIQNILGLDEE